MLLDVNMLILRQRYHSVWIYIKLKAEINYAEKKCPKGPVLSVMAKGNVTTQN